MRLEHVFLHSTPSLTLRASGACQQVEPSFFLLHSENSHDADCQYRWSAESRSLHWSLGECMSPARFPTRAQLG